MKEWMRHAPANLSAYMPLRVKEVALEFLVTSLMSCMVALLLGGLHSILLAGLLTELSGGLLLGRSGLSAELRTPRNLAYPGLEARILAASRPLRVLAALPA